MRSVRVFLIACAVAACGVAKAADVPPGDVVIDDDFSIAEPLTDGRANSFRGLEIFIDRKRGNCVACHDNFDVEAMQFLGEIGPSLNWVGDRYSRGELRAILVNPKKIFGETTIMPAFYSLDTGVRVLEQFQGKTILTAQEIEDLVLYLSLLRKR